MYGCDSEAKAQSLPASLRLKKAQQVQSKVKLMMTVFFSHDVVHYQYASEDQTINKGYHLGVLHCLWDAIHRKSQEL